MKKWLLSAVLVALATAAHAQPFNQPLYGTPTIVTGHAWCASATNSNLAVDCGAGPGGGSVISVGLSLPAIFTVTVSPITISGTLTAVLANETANTAFAGPTTGSAAAPTFRALVDADLPGGVTGSGAVVLATSPTLVTPALGTPSALVLTSATGLPISTGVNGLGTGVATLLGGASSGTGGPAGTTSPSFTTPALGAATGTSLTIAGGLLSTGNGAVLSANQTLLVGGSPATPTMSANGEAALFEQGGNGAVLMGKGSTYDLELFNGSGSPAIQVPTGTNTVLFAGTQVFGATASFGIGGASPNWLLSGQGGSGIFPAVARFSADSNATIFKFFKSRTTTSASYIAATYTAITAADHIMDLQSWGDDGVTAGGALATRLLTGSNGAASSGIVPGRFAFYTANSSGVSQAAFGIDSAQVFGLGDPGSAVFGSTSELIDASGNLYPQGATASEGAYVSSAHKLVSLASPTVGATSAPAGTTSTTLVMLGLNKTITPTASGRLLVIISGDASSGVIGDGCGIQVSHGTGTAPTNGAAVTGTQDGSVQKYVAGTVTAKGGFSLNWIITSLTPATAYWTDLAFEALVGSTCTLADVNTTVIEF